MEFAKEALFLVVSMLLLSFAFFIISSTLRQAAEAVSSFLSRSKAESFLDYLLSRCLEDKTGAVDLKRMEKWRCVDSYEFDFSLDLIIPPFNYSAPDPIKAVIVVDNTARQSGEIIEGLKRAEGCLLPEDEVTYLYASGCSVAEADSPTVPISSGSFPLKEAVRTANRIKADRRILILTNPKFCSIDTSSACEDFMEGVANGKIEGLDVPSFNGEVMIYGVNHLCFLGESSPELTDEIVEMAAVAMKPGAESGTEDFVEAYSPEAVERMVCAWLGRGRKREYGGFRKFHFGSEERPDFSVSRLVLLRNGTTFMPGRIILNIYSRDWIRFAKALKGVCETGMPATLRNEYEIEGSKVCGEWCIDIGCEIEGSKKGLVVARREGRKVVLE